jgi:hypothetical protein
MQDNVLHIHTWLRLKTHVCGFVRVHLCIPPNVRLIKGEQMIEERIEQAHYEAHKMKEQTQRQC